jgi:hypothetical protein
MKGMRVDDNFEAFRRKERVAERTFLKGGGELEVLWRWKAAGSSEPRTLQFQVWME